jgi:uncharacterized protein (TIGR01777 family)
MKRIILAGGSGFLGRVLAKHFQGAGYAVSILSRAPRLTTGDGVREITWDARTLGEWVSELDGAHAIINLTGRSVNCRYNLRNRRLILESRVDATRAIGNAIAKCQAPPLVWLNASTATIYQHTFGPAWNEAGVISASPEAKDEFSIQVATAWERALNEAKTLATRKVALRAAMVLGRDKNSVFPMLRRLAKCGMGGRMGNGKQFVSWIHEADLCRAVEWILAHNQLSGVINVAAPNPVTNEEMMKTFRKIVGVPFGLPAARWMLEIGAFSLRTETELIIKSRRVIPERLTKSGFIFNYPSLGMSLENLQKVKRLND